MERMSDERLADIAGGRCGIPDFGLPITLELVQALKAERAEVERLRAENESRRDIEYFLSWRGIENACPDCGGTGWKAYGSTSTWRGGIGGQAMTGAVCDKCWGSGDDQNPFASHRKLEARAQAAEALLERVRECLKYAVVSEVEGNSLYVVSEDSVRDALRMEGHE